jgi:hypothetical protein
MMTANDEKTAIVFALEDSYEYHNGWIRQWGAAKMEIETRRKLVNGDRIVIKLLNLCAVFRGSIRGTEGGMTSGLNAYSVTLEPD